MINKDGKAVAPTLETLPGGRRQRRLEVAARLRRDPRPNEPGDQSWPITAATFILIHKKPAGSPATAEALKFFDWAYTKGDKMAEELDYVPMPDNVVNAIDQEATGPGDIERHGRQAASAVELTLTGALDRRRPAFHNDPVTRLVLLAIAAPLEWLPNRQCAGDGMRCCREASRG